LDFSLMATAVGTAAAVAGEDDNIIYFICGGGAMQIFYLLSRVALSRRS
jgi:hypothetical protein